MKAINKIIALGAVALTAVSCSLDLEPIDNYGSGSYWKSEAHVLGYVDGLHNNLRSFIYDHAIVMGEVRSGIYVDGTAYDGMTTSYGTERLQNLTQGTPGFSNFDNIFGRITNCNLLIARAGGVDMDANKKNYCLAIAYGLRAFYYYDLYRVWGGVPLRLGVEVIDGELDPNVLTKERATPKEVMTQIKADLAKSIELFGNQDGFNVLGRGNKVYWNKAATLCLAADVYMWNAKVACGDQAAQPEDMKQAITYLEQVENSFGLSLQGNFAKVFSTDNKANSEIIYAVRYAEGEATNNFGSWTYSTVTGQAQQSGYKNEDGKGNLTFDADGNPVFTVWNDPLDLQNGMNLSMAYNFDMWNQFDDADSRKLATFIAQYRPNDVEDFTKGFYLYGIHTRKNIGHTNSAGVHIYDGDLVVYRLPWVYLALAEAYNFEGNYAKCAEYINKVRARAYGDNWGDQYKYTAGDFKTNEYAVLAEKDKEFIQEGQRWWDLRRMTEVKGGNYMEHFVFKDDAAHLDNNGFKLAALNASNAYKVLWPLDVKMLGNDNSLLQNKGYEVEDSYKAVDWNPNGN